MGAFTDEVVELRPVLRSRVKEYEEALFERDAELRQLRHEIQLLRCEKELARQAEKDAILDRPDAKRATVQRHAAALSFVDGSYAKIAFLAWRRHVQQRALKEKLMKSATVAFTSDAARQVAFLFASWRSVVHAARDAQKMKQEKQRYASKFAMQADCTAMRAIIIEWWHLSKEAALRAHVSNVQGKQEAQAKEQVAMMLQAQRQGVSSADKACCALM